MPQKTLISNFNAVESNNALTFDKKTIAKIFKDFFSNLAESLLIKLPNAPNKYNIYSIINSRALTVETMNNISKEVMLAQVTHLP